MEAIESAELRKKRCRPCEGGIPPIPPEQAAQQLGKLPGWTLIDENRRIQKQWRFADFKAAMDFLNRVAEIAEQEDHHPDLHLERYRWVRIEIWTHAVGGLTENDFILAAKIDGLTEAKSS